MSDIAIMLGKNINFICSEKSEGRKPESGRFSRDNWAWSSFHLLHSRLYLYESTQWRLWAVCDPGYQLTWLAQAVTSSGTQGGDEKKNRPIKVHSAGGNPIPRPLEFWPLFFAGFFVACSDFLSPPLPARVSDDEVVRALHWYCNPVQAWHFSRFFFRIFATVLKVAYITQRQIQDVRKEGAVNQREPLRLGGVGGVGGPGMSYTRKFWKHCLQNKGFTVHFWPFGLLKGGVGTPLTFPLDLPM